MGAFGYSKKQDDGTDGNRMPFVHSLPTWREKDVKVESDQAGLPPRIRKLISAAVRVWELKRGTR